MAKRRRKKSTAVVHRRRTASKPAVRRRRRKSGGLGGGMIAPFKNSINAGVGGAMYALASPLTSTKPVTRALIGLAGSFALGYFGFPVMGNGMAGAAAAEFVKSSVGSLSDDDDLQDTEYTDVDLSDKEVYADDQGNVFALGDGDVEPIYLGNMNDGSFDLSGGEFDLSDYTGEQSVMSLPSYNNG